MALSSNKREIQKKKQEKREEKQKRREERKANAGSSSFEDMIAYVDENGVIVSTPPDLSSKKKINIEEIVISTKKKEDTEDSMLEGVVEFLNADKGYGFIKDTASKFKYFFHVSNASASIKEGNKVTFELERGQKGMNAVKVMLAN